MIKKMTDEILDNDRDAKQKSQDDATNTRNLHLQSNS